MNTNIIKSFAKEARLLLLDGVAQRLKYWGFDENGNNTQQLQTTHGGYIFRGQIFSDETVPAKWNKLKNKIKDKESVKDVFEEVAYTWFNRLMAIKILEVNEYIPKQLAFANGLNIPQIVQNAKRGNHELRKQSDKTLLLEYLQEDKEEQAFGLLIKNYCNKNTLIHNVFGKIDDYTEILIPHNLLQSNGVLELINGDTIPEEYYKEVELIGWLYQFYISDRKDEVFAGFKKNKKARAEDIPAATQIFTPKWIVKYMVENTVGKLYLDYEPDSSLKNEMKYLVENESDINREPIIKDIRELTLLDPAAGSGHILVTGFDLLYKMYKEEGYTTKQAVENILNNNLYGLDIDDRAVQLARFAVLLKAAEFDSDVLDGSLQPHIFIFPETQNFSTEEIQSYLGTDGYQYVSELKDALQLMNQGKNIGSALILNVSEGALHDIQKQYKLWTENEINLKLGVFEKDSWNRLKPFIDVLLILSKQFTSIVANPPYMVSGNMNVELKSYLDFNYPKTKGDLFTVFMDLSFNRLCIKGSYGMINQTSWMFKSTYKEFRKYIRNTYYVESLLHLGPRVFEELTGEVVQSTCFIVKSKYENKLSGLYYRLVEQRTSKNKEKQFLKTKNKPFIFQLDDISRIPDNILAYWLSKKGLEIFNRETPLADFGDIKKGIATGDDSRFLRHWYEIIYRKINFNSIPYSCSLEYKWLPINKAGGYRKWSGNYEMIINWEKDGKDIKNLKNKFGKTKSRPQNLTYSFLDGITYNIVSSKGFSGRKTNYPSMMTDVSPTIYNLNNDYYFLGLLSSVVGKYFFDALCPGYKYDTGAIGKFPVKFVSDDAISRLVKRNIDISKYDWDSHEISYDFKKSTLINEGGNLQQSFKIWEEVVIIHFFELHSNEEKINKYFIELYNLQEELDESVQINSITILQDELKKQMIHKLDSEFHEYNKYKLPINNSEVLSQFISYSIGIYLGRYRLDKEGLNIAHPNPNEEELSKYTFNNKVIEIDEDGIVPIMGENCSFPDDALQRIKDLILAIWGEDTLIENVNFLHECIGMDLHKWLNEKFWGYHTKMYKKKPIYWLFSSNIKKPQNAAFKVLVYMHRMDKYTVQKIQRNYLYPHQEYIKSEIESLARNESSLSKEDQKQLEKLRAWEIECRDYNEVLKELANQQIEIDLDDGVSVNIAKFEGAVAKI